MTYTDRRMRYGAMAGLVALPVYLATALILSWAQFDFMSDLGWEVWTSGLSLGPFGFVQILNFVVFGAVIIWFAITLLKFVKPGRFSWLGPVLLMVSGAGHLFLAFNTDPPNAPATWHGELHGWGFVVFMGFLGAAYVATFFRGDLLWRGSRRCLLLAVPFLLLSEVLPNPWGNLFFFVAVLAPLQIMAIWFWRFVGNSTARLPPGISRSKPTEGQRWQIG